MRMNLSSKLIRSIRMLSTKNQHSNKTIKATTKMKFPMPSIDYDLDFICNPKNRDLIYNNIKHRKGVGDIDKVLRLNNIPGSEEELLNELNKIPNLTAPEVFDYGAEPFVLKEYGKKPQFDFQPQEFSTIAKNLKLLRTELLGPLTGQRSYILLGQLARLEEALVHYTIRELLKQNFKLVSVPDVIPSNIIERCGLLSDNGRNLVYNLDSCYENDFSLSGTAEMSLAAKLMNKELDYKELPLKLAAVSRCFRAEVSRIQEEKGIFRVHQFTKVEMFICSTKHNSEEQFKYIQSIQENLFSSLGLHFKVLDMPAHELGAPAYKKIDIEGWMPGRNHYGELSSCSNCTDYQSRRLNIKYRTQDGKLVHAHTLNGTACAIPRMLITIAETYQTKDGFVNVPPVLLPYMNNESIIKKQPYPEMRVHKMK